MTIIRIQQRENPYVQIDRDTIQKSYLSWRARGLLAYLLSMPPSWSLKVSDLVNRAPDGRDAVYNIIRELKEAGYIVYIQTRGENGRLNASEYHVFETPQMASASLTDFQEADNNNPTMPLTTFPNPANADREKPDTYIINNIQNKQIKKETAAEEEHSNMKTTTIAAAAPFLTKQDLLIVKKLTANQLNFIEATVSLLKKEGYLFEFSQQDAVKQIQNTLLSDRCYTKAGKNFSLKLNTIKKSIQRYTWTPPVDSLLKEQSEHEKKMALLQEKRRKIINEIYSQQDLMARFTDYRNDAAKQNKSIDSFNAVLKQAETKLTQLKEALDDFEAQSHLDTGYAA